MGVKILRSEFQNRPEIPWKLLACSRESLTNHVESNIRTTLSATRGPHRYSCRCPKLRRRKNLDSQGRVNNTHHRANPQPVPDRDPSGDEGDRTLNPCLAKAVLSQLSYVPERANNLAGAVPGRRPSKQTIQASRAEKPAKKRGVRAPRFELGTSALSGLRSNQLSYARGRRGGSQRGTPVT